MKILFDTREQKHLEFKNYQDVNLVKETLPCGDYTIVGHDMPGDDNSIIIERKKDCQELIQNLGSGWDRFQREMELLTRYRYKQIVVCSYNNFDVLIRQNFTKLSLNFIYARISYLYTAFDVPIIYAGSRDAAEAYMYRLFTSVERKTKYEY